MNCLPLLLYLTVLIESVLSSLPAPVNVNISSVNFHHVLHWNPGPGTPAGTHYIINKRVNGKNKHPSSSLKTSLKLRLPKVDEEYVLTVQASYNQTLSQESHKVNFWPLTQTIIGPPKISLAGCGNCIHVNISLPEADRSSGIKDMKTIYPGSQFEVIWMKGKGTMPQGSAITKTKNYTVNHLQIGTEYCVQVNTKINVNRNTKPSAWNCTFTSIVEPSRVFVGAVAALLIVIGVLMSSMFSLYYTGFLCKMATLPRVLNDFLSQGYTLTPESTIPDNISIGTETDKPGNHHNPQAATRDTYSDEEEEGENVYMDRDAELSSEESSCQDSIDVSGNSKVAVSWGSGSSTVKAEVGQDTEFEVEVRHGGLDPNEAKAGGTDVSLMPEGPVTGEEKEEGKEEVCWNLGNINLFSVTLAALAVCEEGEEGEKQNTRESLTDLLKLSHLEPLLPTNSKRTLSHTDSQTESDDQTTVALMPPTQEDFTANGYEARRMDTSSGCNGETQHEETQEEEEEEEEEFSGYMGHR
ncbi:interleukin-10 receptor subunit beta-like [Anoplopoma fimbria]|uniref:interleukin-10 receptor subunit beta-like n=1 Tax=Anoplopoma fimbria TaxID=229290 RepID=UPI0023EB791F|nr:interleukin-10 receptor subunit beta-like [Anoplopoma fimbria]